MKNGKEHLQEKPAKKKKDFSIWQTTPKRDERGELENKILRLYDEYAEKYRTYPQEYEKMLEMRQKLNLQPIEKLSGSDLRDYPTIELFQVEKKEIALAKIKLMDKEELYCCLRECSLIEINHTFRTMRDYIYSTKYRMVFRNKKVEIAPHPDALHRGQG